MTVKLGFTVKEINEENSVRVLTTTQNQLLTNHTFLSHGIIYWVGPIHSKPKRILRSFKIKGAFMSVDITQVACVQDNFQWKFLRWQ
jgi:hypothetical protein